MFATLLMLLFSLQCVSINVIVHRKLIVTIVFLRLQTQETGTYFHHESEHVYETNDFLEMSNTNLDHDDIFGPVTRSTENFMKHVALVAHVSYHNGNNSTCWIIDSGSTHHMNDFDNELINKTLEGYDDGDLAKGLLPSTKAYGIGICIVVLKDSVGSFHRICLEDVIYVPNLLHHPTFFSVISACSQDDCQLYFQSNSYIIKHQVSENSCTIVKRFVVDTPN